MPVQLLLSMLRAPASTGAVLPSSRALATAMARTAIGADLIVELGAGTGPVTRALLEQMPGVPLIAVELQPDLAQMLQRRFPEADVRLAPADQVIDALGEPEGAVVLVSSLPFRSLPLPVRSETIASICRFLLADPQRRLVQFTYQPRAPFRAPPGLRWHRRMSVWANTPPAGVWELCAPT
ncbi:MAG: hypothetical protein H2060_01625 [Azoarcus sp.]|nr:hypothetical protein [Azoarcus sp.]